MKYLSTESKYATSLAASLLLAVIYGYIAYFLVRKEFSLLMALTALGFFSTYFVIRYSNFAFKQLYGLAIIYRLIFIFSIPQLSQDFFRFFWDGQLIINGLNPYLHNVDHYFTSGNLINSLHQAETLRQGMGELSAGNFSNYPPVSQYLYALSAGLARDSVMIFIVALRLLLIGFELIVIYYGKKLLKAFNRDSKAIFLYALNPLCIIEITGNLHLEGVMISFFVMSIYYLMQKKYLVSGIILSLSIGTKLVSLIALPLIVMYLWRRYPLPLRSKSITAFLLGLVFALGVQFLPFFNVVFLTNFSESIGLWFGKFEFNASIFYLVRWIGYQIYGYNIIQSYGVIMPVVVSIIFLFITLKMKGNLKSILACFMWMLMIYFLFSTTVHPWYILFPLALGVLTNYKFPILWSFLVFLSYYAYTDTKFMESAIILTIEHIFLILFCIYELLLKKKNLISDFFFK